MTGSPDTHRHWRRIAMAIVVLALAIGLYRAWPANGTGRPAGAGTPENAADADAGPDGIVAGNATADARSRAVESYERCGKAMMAAFREHAASLRQRQDARSQLGYAMTATFAAFAEIEQGDPQGMDEAQIRQRFERQRAEQQQAFARARALAPGDPDILWLAANQCGVDGTCLGMQRELLEAEPDNAAAWMQEMTWARMRNDKDAVERAFERASAATHYDRHAGAGQLAILESFSEVPMPRECGTPEVQEELRRQFPGGAKVDAADFILMMANIAGAMQLPAYLDITRQCTASQEAPLDRGRRAACMRVLEKMAGGDTLVEQSIALRLLVQLAGDGADAARWRERYRNHRWMLSQSATPAIRALKVEDYALDEVGSMQAALLAAGRWPAPRGWLPADERARSLIMTGRPPPETRR